MTVRKIIYLVVTFSPVILDILIIEPELQFQNTKARENSFCFLENTDITATKCTQSYCRRLLLSRNGFFPDLSISNRRCLHLEPMPNSDLNRLCTFSK